jgi:hypothetical protein
MIFTLESMRNILYLEAKHFASEYQVELKPDGRDYLLRGLDVNILACKNLVENATT